MECPNCGEPIERIDRFCAECGTPLEQSTTPYDPNKTVLSTRYRTNEEAHTVPLNQQPERQKTMALLTSPSQGAESVSVENQRLWWLMMGLLMGTVVIICMLIMLGLALIITGGPS